MSFLIRVCSFLPVHDSVCAGKLTVLAGKDGFRADAGPWSVLGADALVPEQRGGVFCRVGEVVSGPKIPMESGKPT